MRREVPARYNDRGQEGDAVQARGRRKSLDIRRSPPPSACRSTPKVRPLRDGETRVVCAATIEERVPPFLRAREGWVTPSTRCSAATITGSPGSRTGKVGGRSTRFSVWLGGRCGRGSTSSAGERTVTVDCDVLQRTGGRTASINGAWMPCARVPEDVAKGDLPQSRARPRGGVSGDRRGGSWRTSTTPRTPAEVD